MWHAAVLALDVVLDKRFPLNYAYILHIQCITSTWRSPKRPPVCVKLFRRRVNVVEINMVLAEFVKFKNGLYKSCGIECFEGIMTTGFI